MSIGWSHIILEGFCFRKLGNTKSKYLYKVVDNDTFKTEKIPNPHYDPNYKTPKKPKYCMICNESKKLQLASKDHEYTSNPLDYIYVCQSCHYRFDSCRKKLKEEGK